MPRTARKISSTGIYHVLFCGTDQRKVFSGWEDRNTLLEEILKHRDEYCYEIYGYCLMDDHIHLLLKEGEKPLADAMKRIFGSYARWYNRKADRWGALFQDRYKSEVIEDDRRFLNVLRHIHREPIMAGLCELGNGGNYSSLGEYLDGGLVVNTKYAELLMHGMDMMEFHRNPEHVDCLEMQGPSFVSDTRAEEIITKVSGTSTLAEVLDMDQEMVEMVIRKSHEEGVSIRQISRLTGISKRRIERILA